MHVLPSLSAEGSQILALEMLRLHDRSRFDVSLALVADGRGPLNVEAARLEIPIFRLHWRQEYLQQKGVLGYAPLTAKMFQICRQWKPDAVLIYGMNFDIFIGLGARLAGVRNTTTRVGNAPVVSGSLGRLKVAALLRIGRIVNGPLVACSQQTKEYMRREYGLSGNDIVAVQNGVNVAEIGRRARQQRTIGNRSGTTLGMVASLELSKDHATLLQAFALVRQKHPTVRLWLIGGGSLESDLRRQASAFGIADVVEFLGVRRDIPELLAEIDLFVFSVTPHEGFGIVLIEALAAGVPIVSSDVPAAREVLAEGEYGVLVPARDASALADAIVALIDDPRKRERLHKAGVEYVRRFDSTFMTREYENVLFRFRRKSGHGAGSGEA